MMYYSASTRGFYAAVGPDDCVEVSDIEYEALFEAQSVGCEIRPDAQGKPRAVLPAVVPVVPTSVTMRQARLALLAAGLLQGVGESIAAMPQLGRAVAQIEWEYAQTVERASPFTQQLAAALGLDDAALDALFIDAAAR